MTEWVCLLFVLVAVHDVDGNIFMASCEMYSIETSITSGVFRMVYY